MSLTGSACACPRSVKKTSVSLQVIPRVSNLGYKTASDVPELVSATDGRGFWLLLAARDEDRFFRFSTGSIPPGRLSTGIAECIRLHRALHEARLRQEGLTRPMAGRRILITGICGFVGSTLARGLLAAGHEVMGFDNFIRPGSETNRARREVS